MATNGPLHRESFLECLSQDSLAQLTSFLDFRSAVQLASVNSKIRETLLKRSPHVWRDCFERHGFSSQDRDRDDFLQETKHRIKLFTNLLPQSRRANCFHLPNRFYSFLPIAPFDARLDDPPPVNWDCESFLLTSTATSREFVHTISLLHFAFCITLTSLLHLLNRVLLSLILSLPSRISLSRSLFRHPFALQFNTG
jgi:hypothetical protein